MIWLSNEPENLARLAHYMYTEEALRNMAVRVNLPRPVSARLLRDHVFPGLPGFMWSDADDGMAQKPGLLFLAPLTSPWAFTDNGHGRLIFDDKIRPLNAGYPDTIGRRVFLSSARLVCEATP